MDDEAFAWFIDRQDLAYASDDDRARMPWLDAHPGMEYDLGKDTFASHPYAREHLVLA